MDTAITLLEDARNALHDAGLECLGGDAVAIAFAELRDSPRPNANLDLLSRAARALRKDLREANCPECGHLVARHANRRGCDHERGDEGRCGCRWGQE